MRNCDKRVVIVLLGRPGSGKGTQSQLLQERGWRHVGIGSLLRSEVARGTLAGRIASHYMQRGTLVPAPVVTMMLKRTIRAAGQQVTLDGYPRRRYQVNSLDRLLGRYGSVIPIYLDISVEASLFRLTHRIACPVCDLVGQGETDETCPKCRVPMVRRRDDSVREVVLRRHKTFEEETAGVVEVYRASGRLITVNGEASPINVLEKILSAVSVLGVSQPGAGELSS